MQSVAKRVFIVESEAMLAMLLEDYLQEIGWEIAGSAGCLTDALAMAKTLDFDAAVLNATLPEGRSDSVARSLRARGVPYFFYTKYNNLVLACDIVAPVLDKPFDLEKVGELLFRLLSTKSSSL